MRGFYQSLLSLALLMLTSLLTSAAPIEYKVNEAGDVVFTAFVENLPLKAADIHRAATEYLSEAYKEAKYDITECNNEKLIVVGKGKFNNFYNHNGILSSDLYSVHFNVRIDSKDNRARLQFIVRNYDIMNLSDIGNKNAESVLISKCSPVGRSLDSKAHRKAFEALMDRAAQVLAAIKVGLQKATPSVEEDNDW